MDIANNPKYLNLMECSFDDVTEVIDAAISLVLKIDEISHKWISGFIGPRDSKGLFPDGVFN
jgi:hypothetical protein